ncbi:hypothetical protein ACFYYR_03300 [Streptomyces sp. NPDC001922]|uniref:hypothetical protein n=1 Tax=Streptomyces sp. NPDC001922 TaxID=3364624 RepID=UPI0036CD40F3
MRSVKARAADIASRLTAATGMAAHVEGIATGTRVVAELPDRLSASAWRVVLAALVSADRYGHGCAEGRQQVWVEVDREEPS